ncbi:hypothetical protein JOM56_006832 [Amanita muscaria]
MAPRTRAAARCKNANRGSNYNTRGFVKLPLEILFQIVSAAQGAIIPCMNEAAMEKKYSERRDSLSALCQVCCSLRVALLPLLWGRLEACCLPSESCCLPGNQNNRDRWRLLTKKLISQLMVLSVIQPLYASYVRIVNIGIEPRVASEMLFNLAPALALMPNLHTIQIVIDPNYPKRRTNCVLVIRSTVFRNAFKDYLYPSVKRAVLPGQAMTILECFPQVREVCLNQAYHGGSFFSFLGNLARNCDKLERFGWIQFSQDQDSRAAAIAEKLPNIRGLEYHIKNFNVIEISPLARLQHLEDLSLIMDAYDDISQCDDAVLEVAEATKKVLETSPSINKRLNDQVYAPDE